MSDREAVGTGLSRRSLLQTGAMATAATAALGLGATDALAAASEEEQSWPRPRGRSMIGVPFEPHREVRVGVIGLGNRGLSMVPLFLAVPGTHITALCDTRREMAERATKMVRDAGQPSPALHTGHERAFEALCRREDVDFVYVATPWEWHVPMAVSAMRFGKHVGVECPLAMTLRELWELVDTSELTRRHCIQLENCCYGRNELRVLRMAHDGMFGELLHGAGAYLHDLRDLLFSDTYYADEWRRAWHTKLNADLYPTHGLGPVAGYLDVNRGDRLVRMTAMSTPALGLADHRHKHEEPGDSSWRERYVKGDTTMSLIQTARGRVIRLQHNVSNPYPYSRLNQLAGTRGVFEDYPPRIYLEPDHSGHRWGSFDDYVHYDHWLWTDVGPGPGGHGGMDYIMLYRTIQTMRLGLVPDIDVYDSATWSAPVAMSAESIRRGGTPMPFPDFTRGRWREPRPGLDSRKPQRQAA
ncbi:glycosyl hydrolase family 109 protein [Longimycelium tulufanense]|uniref:Glycosyl hydrolase family 109 protein n=1 Tax=Longimycelium tulufanense TaxID=907463 RepID=A0A8J3CIL9_9PSEU|nr:Gfo/Idh/MocA family oxidoreductase [Longimycelium tulufanense]GGM72792.1 glycosyl hydrolase family 109 protein [Longimycelium tulufanense]